MTDWSMTCRQCGADLGGMESQVAAISVRVQGDEEDRTYFLCAKCDVYSEWVCIEDFFTDELTTFATGPISRERGDAIVALIRECSDPMIASCRCPAHEKLSSSGD